MPRLALILPPLAGMAVLLFVDLDPGNPAVTRTAAVALLLPSHLPGDAGLGVEDPHLDVLSARGEGDGGSGDLPPGVPQARPPGFEEGTVLVVCAVMTFLIELTSNTATSQMALPILAGLAVAVRLHPLFLMLPATISASCAFMLPVATPPNAIAFGTGRLRMSTMAKTGVLINLVGICVVTVGTYIMGRLVLGIDPSQFPSWAGK